MADPARFGTAARDPEGPRPGRGNVSLGFREFDRMRTADLIREARLFGGGDAGFFAFGPHDGLIGRRASRVRAAPPSGARARLDESRLLADVDPAGPAVPAYLSGEITSGLGPGEPLAVAVNGSSATVVSTWPDGGAVRFSALVPPTAFRDWFD